MWSKIRNKQLLGYRFLRQRPISHYIVDFLQPELKLIVEVDGSSHDEDKYEYDDKRQTHLENLGFQFLRFTEFEVRFNVSDVVETIFGFLENHSP